MATTINNTTTGILTTPDNTGALAIQINGTNAIYVDTSQNCGFGFTPDGSSIIQIKAGTATTAPLELTSSAGTLMTTPDGGSIEYDGFAFYGAIQNSQRGVLLSEQFVALSSNNALSNQTGAQAMFLTGAGLTTGALSVDVGSYFFECFYNITGMSATSGSFGFALGGGATKTQFWQATGQKGTGTVSTATATTTSYNTAANTSLTANSTNTVGYAYINGFIRVTVAGTLIPQISLTVTSTPTITSGSYFKIRQMGNSTVQIQGNWA
jgi:hypothetical protein